MPAQQADNAGMKKQLPTHPIQYTIRDIPKRVDDRLRESAAHYGVSLNQAAREALARGLGVNGEPIMHDDLDDLIGTWVNDPAFDKAIKTMDRIDTEMWK
jgi:plasmid stability protein